MYDFDGGFDSNIEMLDVKETTTDVNDIDTDAAIEMLEIDDEVMDTTVETDSIDETYFDKLSLDDIEGDPYHATDLSPEGKRAVYDEWMDNKERLVESNFIASPHDFPMK